MRCPRASENMKQGTEMHIGNCKDISAVKV